MNFNGINSRLVVGANKLLVTKTPKLFNIFLLMR